MREVGYDLTAHRSKSLSDIPAIEYDAVIGMGCGDEGCPLVRAKRREGGTSPTRRNCRLSGFGKYVT
jgi:arsenate reductase (thioredoxin)